ncbi:hypothetical protein NDU88_006228 [Pleurodeles waltl]|uniref:Uncharacterized protein n=1 Tax=Pleurodeles waltl TaxID=8319 RepID=A0AAV7SNX8_PLEWA|nr:hypothetical protein NDU88_006228 [Pleurodeles waltl]
MAGGRWVQASGPDWQYPGGTAQQAGIEVKPLRRAGSAAQQVGPQKGGRCQEGRTGRGDRDTEEVGDVEEVGDAEGDRDAEEVGDAEVRDKEEVGSGEEVGNVEEVGNDKDKDSRRERENRGNCGWTAGSIKVDPALRRLRGRPHKGAGHVPRGTWPHQIRVMSWGMEGKDNKKHKEGSTNSCIFIKRHMRNH